MIEFEGETRYTDAEAAAILGETRQQTHQLLKKNRMPLRMIFGRPMVFGSDLGAFKVLRALSVREQAANKLPATLRTPTLQLRARQAQQQIQARAERRRQRAHGAVP